MRFSPQARARLAVLLFFAGLLISGALGYRDYGIGWDEPYQWMVGYQSYGHLVEGDPALLTSPVRYYGPVVEIPLVAIEKFFDLSDSREIFLLRHALTFLLFCLGVWWLHRLATARFGNPYWGLVAAAILAASPRIYGDAFCNTKDIPFMAFFIGSMLALRRLVERPSGPRALLFGLAAALAIDTRVIGLFVLGFGGIVGAWTWWHAPREQRREQFLFWTLALVSSLAFSYAFWPLLWGDPLDVLKAIVLFSHYPFTHAQLYLGEFVLPVDLPWHYIPVWIAITTPLPYLALAVIGVAATLVRLKRQPADGMDVLLPLLWLLLPWAVIVARGAVLYDAWRHLFFVYPALALLATEGLRSVMSAPLRHARLVRGTLAGLCGLAWLEIVVKMVAMHPHQNVYFNAWVPPARAETQFELDYWGLSYREGFEAVLRDDPRSKIYFWVANRAGQFNGLILPTQDRDRVEFAPREEQADYVLTNFRGTTARHPDAEVYALRVNGIKIMAVYKGRAERD